MRLSIWRLSVKVGTAVLACVLGGLLAAPVPAQTAISVDEFRLLPLRVHLLQAKHERSLHTDLTKSDVRRVLGKINGIWKQAGLQFFEESILVEEAAGQELYAQLGGDRLEGLPRLVRPRASRSPEMFHIYFIGEMGPNGVCFDRSWELLFVKEAARLRPVRGGIDEPLPRVCAHEMGHALTLEHRQDRVNLMASGTTGTSLNEVEIKAARKCAEERPWHLTPSRALTRADEMIRDQKKDAARSLYTCLANLPGGAVAQAAREVLGKLQDEG